MEVKYEVDNLFDYDNQWICTNSKVFEERKSLISKQFKI